MIYNERTQRHEQVVAAAHQMMTAARTAPKARGVDIIEAALIEGNELRQLADRMVEIGNERNRPSFIRDAGNVLQSEAVLQSSFCLDVYSRAEIISESESGIKS